MKVVAEALHTWRALGAGASSYVDYGLVRRLGVVGLQRGHADALAQFELTLALLDDLHLPGPLKQEHAVHAHPGRLAQLAQAAGGQLVLRLWALRSCSSARSHLSVTVLILVQTSAFSSFHTRYSNIIVVD